MGRKVYEASVPCCKDVVIIAAHHAVSAKAGNSNTAGETNFLMDSKGDSNYEETYDKLDAKRH